jgi:hypothetical protein
LALGDLLAGLGVLHFVLARLLLSASNHLTETPINDIWEDTPWGTEPQSREHPEPQPEPQSTE